MGKSLFFFKFRKADPIWAKLRFLGSERTAYSSPEFGTVVTKPYLA